VDDRYFTATEAAEALGVSISTLYVYVGRKGIDRSPFGLEATPLLAPPTSNDCARMARTCRKRLSISKSTARLTLLTEDDVFYRGRSAIALSETASFETVAALLWNAERDAGVLSTNRPLLPPFFTHLTK